MVKTGRDEQRTAQRKIGDPVRIAALSERSSDPARVAGKPAPVRGEENKPKDHFQAALCLLPHDGAQRHTARGAVPATLPFFSPRTSRENSAGESFRLLDTLSRVIFRVNQ